MPAQGGSVAAAASYATLPDVALAFEPDHLILKVASGTCDISFDGTNTFFTLATADAAIVLHTKLKNIWFRQNGGASTIRWGAITTA